MTQTTASGRLSGWRDVGDGPHAYCAGNADFAADVKVLLADRDRLLEALKAMLENYGPPAAVAAICKYHAAHPITLARMAIAKAEGAESV